MRKLSTLILLALLALLTVGCEEDSPTQTPSSTLSPSASMSSRCVGEGVVVKERTPCDFLDTSLFPDGLALDSRLWSLSPEGVQSVDRQFTHTFLRPGTSTVNLKVTADNNLSDETEAIVEVVSDAEAEALASAFGPVTVDVEGVLVHTKAIPRRGTWEWVKAMESNR